MSTIKVDTIQTRGGVSEIAIDKLKGASSAGSMTVVGEGGSTTTNLQQGLAKAWANTSGDGTPVIDDSFNNASLTDNGTGNQTFTFTNNMTNSGYCCNISVLETGFVICIQILGQATSNTNIKSHSLDPNSADSDGKNYSNNGDLA